MEIYFYLFTKNWGIKMLVYLKNLHELRQYEKNSKLNIPALDNLFEPFIGRINFKEYFKLFNFENNIYEDKQFKYSIISNFNKRIIPEFISGALASLIYREAIDLEIRSKLEHYMIGIMSNMDYINLANLPMILDYKINSKNRNLLFVLGTAATTFNGTEYEQLMTERIKTAIFTRESLKDFIKIESNTISLRDNNYNEQLWKTLKKNVGNLEDFFNAPEFELKERDGLNKLTKNNIEFIFKSTRKALKRYDNYNLFLICSTHQLLKLAIEIEKLLYEDNNYQKPNSIILIGSDRFYDLISNKSWLSKGTILQSLKFGKNIDLIDCYHVKKLQCFLFEFFLHVLDKNKFK